MHRALPALAAVALLATGCASRGSVRPVQDDLAGLHADVSELRHSYEVSARELARIIECAPKSKTKTWEVLPKGSADQAA